MKNEEIQLEHLNSELNDYWKQQGVIKRFNMICVNNVVSACNTTGINGNEGRIMRKNILPCLLIWAVLAGSAAIIIGIFF